MANDQPSTIPELLTATVARAGEQTALATITNGELSWRTWAEVHHDVERFAAYFADSGIAAGDRVVQWAPNSYAWLVTDLALLSIGAVHVPLHATTSTQQLVELLKLADPQLLVVPDEASLSSDEIAIPLLRHAELFSAPDAPPTFFDSLPKVTNQQLATLLFTSGTTGQPNGVMLSHKNLVENTIATSNAIGSDVHETRLCFLPFSHIYARTCDLYCWLDRGTKLVLAESRDTIIRDCQLAKPQIINSVPYFYQKVALQLHDAESGALKQLLGGQIKRCYCGGAAISPEVATLFGEQGLPILAGYGLTETSPVVSTTAPNDFRAGTVGRPLSNLEVRISDDGEILVRGPSVMLGYWNNPEKTAETIVDGWLHTGDLGALDEAGHLRIIGRLKEILVLSTGKNVSPSRVEQLLSGSRLIEHVCVVGEGRKCLGALIVPNPETLRKEIRNQRLWVWSRRRALTHPKVLKMFRQEIDRLLDGANAEEQVGCFKILDRNFSVEAGELTTKLSLRRKAIAENFAKEIENMYTS